MGIPQHGQFFKVSYEKFCEAMQDCFGYKYSGQEQEIYDSVSVPNSRATIGSAGYDIASPIDFTLRPGESIKFPAGIRIKLDDGWFLACMPRSGLGMKYRLQLDNTIGIIDSDYFFSSNEGQLFFKITNDSRENRTLEVHQGDRVAQTILMPFGIVYDDATAAIRNGGMGSTGL